MAKRIQQKRTKGWRMPDGAKSVSRPGRFGNPFVVGKDGTAAECVVQFDRWMRGLDPMFPQDPPDISELRGKDLACWCRLDQPCHADVLLRLVNATP